MYIKAPEGGRNRGVNGSMAKSKILKPGFPYCGGKSTVADLIWERFGNVDNFVEPFMGSAAVLLRRPAEHFKKPSRMEAVNDVNDYIVNYFRALKADPDKVAYYADNPVIETDLHARHRYLCTSADAKEFHKRMVADPDYFDAKFAGWWVWGASCWIGPDWCINSQPSMFHSTGRGDPTASGISEKVPRDRGSDVSAPTIENMPMVEGRGDTASFGRPQLADKYGGGRGVCKQHSVRRPSIGDTNGRGGNTSTVESERRVQMTHGNGDNAIPMGTCEQRLEWLKEWFAALSDRLRMVRICCGHWNRVCNSTSTLTRHGMTGVFLDPPYPIQSTDGKVSRDDGLYHADDQDLNALRDEVLAWCLEWGTNPLIRAVVCCYEGDGYEPLEQIGWTVHHWKANGGYANKKGKASNINAGRERIYFSPNCLKPASTLFDEVFS